MQGVHDYNFMTSALQVYIDAITLLPDNSNYGIDYSSNGSVYYLIVK